jgi:hypothetical protein
MPSSLADHLRALTDDGLGELLRLRPDLVVPVPTDLSALAARLQGRASVARVLDSLDQFTLEVIDGLRVVRGSDDQDSFDVAPAGKSTSASLETLLAMANVDPALVRAAVGRLRERFLVTGPDSALHLVPAVDELTPPYPAGLGRPAAELDPDVAMLVADAAGLRRTLLSAPPEARAVLDRLAAGPPVGSVQPGALRELPPGPGGPDARRTAAARRAEPVAVTTNQPDVGKGGTVESAVRWLVQHLLLVAVTDDTVELPREIGIVLRRETGALGPLHPHPPVLDVPVRSGVDSAGAGQALDAVRQLEAVLQAVADSPPTVLRSYGLGVRDLRRLAKDVGIAEPVTALLLEVAYAAGLLTHTEADSRTPELQWLPTPAFDTWRAGPLAVRWTLTARTWLAMTRAPIMVGQRDDKDKPVNALSHEASRLSAPPLRRAALTVLAELPVGSAVPPEGVLDQLAWQSPRRAGRVVGAPTGPRALTRAALAEAATLGVTALDALTSYGRLLLAEADRADDDPLGIRADRRGTDAVADALGRLLPVPVDHLLIQADLTVIVPGPPEPALSAELALVADTESRGGATVYRVTPASVRRALDAGYAATDVHALFHRRSRTALPQTLTYLIDDVARRHGGLRVGTAGAYLRGDDETLLAEVFADRRLSALSLRRLAPTVLATPLSAARLLDLLRDAGYAPVPEDASGAVVLRRPTAPRGPARIAPRGGLIDDFNPPTLTGPRLLGIVEQIRLGDRLARATRRSPLSQNPVGPDGAPLSSSQAHTQALAVLQQAMREQARVWVGYVDAHGSLASKLVRPVSIGAGYLRAEDDRSETLHTFALHRITSAVRHET